MAKIIPHRLTGRYIKEVPSIIELLGGAPEEVRRMTPIFEALSNATEHELVDIECEETYFITKEISEKEPVIRLFIEKNKFDILDESNIVCLPVDPRQAFFFNRSSYSNPSMESYLRSFHDGIERFLGKLSATQDIKSAASGDDEALARLLTDFHGLLSYCKRGAEDGKFYIAEPYRPMVEEFTFLFSSGYWSLEDVIKKLERIKPSLIQ